MCLLILEFIFLVAGLWLLVTGKIPSKYFGFLFGKGEYRLSPGYTRLFGLMLAIPLPFAFGIYSLLGTIMAGKYLAYAEYLEIGVDMLVFIVAILLARKIRQSSAAGDQGGRPSAT